MEELLLQVADGLRPPAVVLVVAGSWVLAEDAMRLPEIFEQRSRDVTSRIDRLYIESGHPDAPDEPQGSIDEVERLRDAADRTERRVLGAGLLIGGLAIQVVRYLTVAVAELGASEWTYGLVTAAAYAVFVHWKAGGVGDRLRELSDKIARVERRVDDFEGDASDG